MENDTKSKYPPPPPIPDFSSQTERRERTFPITVLQTPDGRCQMLYDNEYREWEAKFEAWKRECVAIDAADKAAREAELAAGRPIHPENPPAADSKGCSGPVRDSKGHPSNHPTRMVALSDQRESKGGAPHSPAELADSTLASYRNSLAHTSPTPAPPPDLVRHSRYCSICSHPDRDAIEGDFIRWRSPMKIAEDYGINDRRNIYRHTHATGLFERRTREVARILEQYMELVDHHLPDNPDKFDFDSVTRAVRVYAHLAPGLWFEPIRTYQILTGPTHAPIPTNGRGIENAPKTYEVVTVPPKEASPSKSKKRKRPRKKNLQNSQNGTRHTPEAALAPTP